MMKEENPKNLEQASLQKAMGQGYTLALNLVVSTVLGLAIGMMLDKWLGTTPLFLLSLMCLGFAAGMYQMIKNTKF